MKFRSCQEAGAKYTLLAAFLANLSIGTIAQAAPGYTYHLLWEGPNQQNFGSAESYCPGVAINNRGDVVFRTSAVISAFPYVERNRIYVSWGGQVPEVVYETVTNNDDPAPSGVQCNENPALLGINDNGIVAVPARWVETDLDGNIIAFHDVGYVLVEPGIGVIRELRGLRSSSGRLNSSLQMAGVSGSQLIVTDGISSQSSALPSSNHTIGQHAIINESGSAAAAGTLFSLPSTRTTTVYLATPPGVMNSAGLGTYSSQDGLNLTGYTDFFTPGLNNLGWISLSTNGNNTTANPNPSVVLVDPAGAVFPIAQAVGSDFGNFRQTRGQSSLGTSLNNFNRVSFVGQLDGDEMGGSAGKIYVGDPSGDVARAAIDNGVTFGDGRTFDGFNHFANDVADHGVNSMNDLGEIVASNLVNVSFDGGISFVEQKQILLIARPVPGLEPGNPIIPAPENALPGGGWRILPCWSAIQVAPFRCWVDPPVAVGYDYSMESSSPGAFSSVLVPVPLAGGDSDFTVEFNGVTAALTAGTALEFAAHSADPVRQFRISGIDLAEELDPADPTAFVAGLTFSAGVTDSLAFTMVPVVVDDSVDSTPPVIQASVMGKLGNADWYRGNVTVSWNVNDAESAISASTGCGASSVRIDTAGVTFTCSATSAGGMSSTYVTIKRDATAPAISIVQPAKDATYSRNQIVNASYTCDDQLSGVQSCVGSVAVGQPISTSKKAKNAKFNVTATDIAGNIGKATTTYSVN
jgi:hypothetical protein